MYRTRLPFMGGLFLFLFYGKHFKERLFTNKVLQRYSISQANANFIGV